MYSSLGLMHCQMLKTLFASATIQPLDQLGPVPLCMKIPLDCRELLLHQTPWPR
jgi:hypothetical protein